MVAATKDESTAMAITESLEKSLVFDIDEDAEMGDSGTSPSTIPSGRNIVDGMIAVAGPSTGSNTNNGSNPQSPSPASEAMNKLNTMDTN